MESGGDPVILLQKEGKLTEEQLHAILKLQNARQDPMPLLHLICKDQK